MRLTTIILLHSELSVSDEAVAREPIRTVNCVSLSEQSTPFDVNVYYLMIYSCTLLTLSNSSYVKVYQGY